MVNALEGAQVFVEGEGTYVSALAATSDTKTSLILTNYDQRGTNTEAVPVTFMGLPSGDYNIVKKYLDGRTENILNLRPINGEIRLDREKSIVMTPNSVVSLILTASQNTR